MGVSKVVFGETTLIDITGSTVASQWLREGFIAFGADGEVVNGAVPDGDPIGYGSASSPIVGIAIVDSTVVGDDDTVKVGRAMADLAVITNYAGTRTSDAIVGLAVLAE